MSESHYEQATALRNHAYKLVPECSGYIDDHPFQWIADADSRLGPVIELILDGKYYWVPFQSISSISLSTPEDLRDLVWAPAHFTWANGGHSRALIPARYPGSDSSEDSALQLARKTEWLEPAKSVFEGVGQRMFATDLSEYPLLDIRQVKINSFS